MKTDSTRVVECVSLYKMPPDKDGRYAMGCAIILEDGTHFFAYYDDHSNDRDGLDFSNCRFLYEDENGDFFRFFNEKLEPYPEVIEDARKILKQYYRGLRTWAEVVKGFKDIGISEKYIPNWQKECGF